MVPPVTFSRFWLTAILPLSFALPMLLNAVWERRLVNRFTDSPEITAQQFGFPLPAVMDYCCASVTAHFFVLPFLLNWLFYALVLTLLAWRFWPRLRNEQRRIIRGVSWLMLLPTLFLNGLTFMLSVRSWVSPYPVLETISIRPHFGLW